MKSSEKTILFARLTVERKTSQWPIATFNTPVAASTYAAFIKMAHSQGDAVMAKSLDPQVKLDDNGHIIPGTKFSLKTVPYEPSVVAPLAPEDMAEDSPTT